MSPQEWIDFEEKVKKQYADMTLYQLMTEESNLAYVLSNPHKLPRLENLDFDKINCRLRLCVEAYHKRIDDLIARGTRNGNE